MVLIFGELWLVVKTCIPKPTETQVSNLETVFLIPQTLQQDNNPNPREDPESRSPNLGPYTTKGTL